MMVIHGRCLAAAAFGLGGFCWLAAQSAAAAASGGVPQELLFVWAGVADQHARLRTGRATVTFEETLPKGYAAVLDAVPLGPGGSHESYSRDHDTETRTVGHWYWRDPDLAISIDEYSGKERNPSHSRRLVAVGKEARILLESRRRTDGGAGGPAVHRIGLIQYVDDAAPGGRWLPALLVDPRTYTYYLMNVPRDSKHIGANEPVGPSLPG